jgi:hypothetical protein
MQGGFYMKKVFILFVVFLLCFSSLPVFADEADDLLATFEAASFDELMQLNNIIQQFLVKKSVTGGNGVLIEPGTYEVGIDIPIGNYYFEGVKGRFPASIHVYPSWDKMGSFDETQYIYNIGYGSSSDAVKSGKFALFDGNIVQIIQGPVIIHVYTGFFM